MIIIIILNLYQLDISTLIRDLINLQVAQTGNIDIARILIENEAEINVASECKTLPIHDAVQAGHPEIIRLLLEHGADPNKLNNEGQSALDLANYSEVIKSIVTEFTSKPRPSSVISITSANASLPPISSENLVLMSSSLKGADVQAFNNCATLLGAKTTSRFDQKVTHLIVTCDESGNTQRTLKFLQCVAAGCWIVSVGWAHKCLAQGHRVDEAPFEARGCRQFPANGAPRAAREARAHEAPGLFSGFSIYFAPQPAGAPQLVPSMEELAKMCENSGAKVLQCEPMQGGGPVRSTHLKQGSILAAHSSFIIGASIATIKNGVLWLTRDWVIDSISQFELAEFVV